MKSQHFMLDTNTVSCIIKGQSESVRDHLTKVPMASICISAITEAELLRGVAKKSDSKKLASIVNGFLLRVQILPWDSKAANAYALLRTACEKEGKPLGAMDMLIAAHSLSSSATLITNDKAFHRISHHIKVNDWTKSHEEA
ncbi:type II toxin-antitoxin system VapC family toxin [bacterium]|nr:type II toxin-antitoxin system VapC family toxin [bacterium]